MIKRLHTDRFLALFAIIFSVMLLSFPFSVDAVTVGPAKIEYKVSPGDTISGRLFVLNEQLEPANFYAAFEKFIEKDGKKKFLPSEPTELAQWFNMEKSVSLGAKEQKEIPFTINIPRNAPPGGHFAVIWWGTAPPESEQVAIVTRAGILVFLQVSGDVNEKGEVIDFSVPEDKFFTYELPGNFIVNFENQGNTYLKPRGKVEIKNVFNSTVLDFVVNGKELIILPENKKELDVRQKSNDELPFALGLYKAELSLQWGEKQNDFQKLIYFFVFPWKVVLIAVLIIIAILFLMTKGLKKYNQWIIKKAGKLQK